jgi:hypothetical protein
MNGDDDAMPFYLLGLATGLSIGLVLGMPSSNELVVKLDRSDLAALADPAPRPDAQRRICDGLRDALAERVESREPLGFICPEP